MGFRSGKRYRVKKDFVDYQQNHFTKGEVLLFVEEHFLAHDGGYTFKFQTCSIYLQEFDQAEILDHLEEYFEELV